MTNAILARISVGLLSLTVPALCGTSMARVTLSKEERESDYRQKLAEYVYQLTVLCDMQIEELAAVVPREAVESLRSEHYAWKLHRDLSCAEEGRNSPDPLRELECLSELSEEYYLRREEELAETEVQHIEDTSREEEPFPLD